MHRAKLFIILFYLIIPFLLSSETIIDSVYSDPILDGEIFFSQNNQAYSVNNWMYDMLIGDTDDTAYIPDPDSYLRGFISFELPDIPENYFIDSCYVRLYQYSSCGQGYANQFPVWDVTGGDTLKCILSHIDYGAELDAEDWPKGDVGNPYTYSNNVGTVTDSWEEGYRSIDVTFSVLSDYEICRSLSQYRIAFQIDTDWDNLGDHLGLITGNSQAEFARPQLFFHLSDEISYSENDIISSNLNLKNYPNPFNPSTTISFNLQTEYSDQAGLSIYNLKGQIIKKYSIFNSQSSIVWNGTDLAGKPVSSGIYYAKLNINGVEVAVNKMLLLK